MTLWKRALGLSLVVGVVGAWVASSGKDRSESRVRLVRTLGGERVLEGRLAGFPYRPLPKERISREALTTAARQFNTWAGRQPASYVAIEKAFLWLLEGRRDLALGYLGEALPRNGDAISLSDLAAAYLERGIAENEPLDFIRALDAADRAFRLDPKLPEARFNLALALEKAHLTRQAIRAWREALQAERDSAWGEEIRQRLARLELEMLPPSWSGQVRRLERAISSHRKNEVREIVREFTFEARRFAEEEALGHWAEAWLEGRTGQATRSLRTAEAVGEALVQVREDSLLSETVAAITLASPERLSELAQGHRAYSSGIILLDRNLSSDAIGEFQKASAHLKAGGSPFALWADLSLAICWQYQGRYPEALQWISLVLHEVSSKKYPSLAARANWIAGLVQMKQSLPVEAGAAYRKSLAVYESLCERENIAALQVLLAENRRLQGQVAEAWSFRLRALDTARSARSPVWLHNALFDAAEATLRQGLSRVALLFQNEMVEEARQQHEAMTVAEALVQRSRTHSRLASFELAAQDLVEARRWCDRIEEAMLRSATRADIEAAEGERLFWFAPAESLSHWDKAIAFYRQDRSRLLLPDLYRRRAAVQLRSGEIAKAEADLYAGIVEYEAIRQRLGNEIISVAYFDQARSIFDSMVALQASQSERAAFDWAERGRARNLLDLLGTPLLDAQAIQESLSPKATLVSYAVLNRMTLVWVVTRERLSMCSIEIPQEDLARKVRALRRSLSREDRTAFRTLSQELYATLIAPARKARETDGELIIVADKFLASLPFAALQDPDTGRFLVEDKALVFAPSGSHFVRAQKRSRELHLRFGNKILAVGNPAFDQVSFPIQRRLPGAAKEVSEISTLYDQPIVLIGEEATKERVLEEARHTSVLHLAAHALSEAEPGGFGSILLATSSHDVGDAGILYSHEVYRKSFPNLGLVVLAGCGTAAGEISAGEGVMSLARPFLAKGVPSVVASLWNSSDITSRKLFLAFHRTLLSGKTPAEALQEAQVQALTDTDLKVRWPGYWAGFQVFGGS
jgi:CHAT domain-containing protein/tetratricopeptide (TPR) repeat protein